MLIMSDEVLASHLEMFLPSSSDRTCHLGRRQANQKRLRAGTNMTKRCSYLSVLSTLLVGAISAYQPSNDNDVNGDLRHGSGCECAQDKQKTIGAATYRRSRPSWPWMSSESDYLEKIAPVNDVRGSDLVIDFGSAYRVRGHCAGPSVAAKPPFTTELWEVSGEAG